MFYLRRELDFPFIMISPEGVIPAPQTGHLPCLMFAAAAWVSSAPAGDLITGLRLPSWEAPVLLQRDYYSYSSSYSHSRHSDAL